MKKLLELLNNVTGEFIQTTSEVTDCIYTKGVHTGSTAWNVDEGESDIDIILSPDCGLSFGSVVCNYNGIYLHEDEDNDIISYMQEDFQSCYVLYRDKIYNLLFMNTQEAYDKWVYATDKMSKLVYSDPIFKEKIRDKEYRVDCFEGYKDEYEEGL